MGTMKRTFKRDTDDDKKKEIIERLAEVWKKNPGLRLGQLIANMYHPGGMLITEEDYDLINLLEEYYK